MPLFLLASACGFREEASDTIRTMPDTGSTPLQVPEASPLPEYTVSFLNGSDVLFEASVPHGEPLPVPTLPDGVTYRVLRWIDGNGNDLTSEGSAVYSDLSFRAVTRPLINENAAFLMPDTNGCLRPNDFITHEEAVFAINSLFLRSEDKLTADVSADACTVGEFLAYADKAFEVSAGFAPTDSDRLLTRAEAADCIATLSGRIIETPETPCFYPDVSPNSDLYDLLLCCSFPGTISKEELFAEATDNFIWRNGYLYRLDDNANFITDSIYDGLQYDRNGRYTCGHEDLDAYVAEKIRTLTDASAPRKDRLERLFNHVRDDYRYLVRNYYAPGATGWEIDEALTLKNTGMGNCYCYTGMFWALARGLGYNTVTYSGTMGIENQPHSWSEINLDGEVYICDPEIEMNYWYLHMYVDTFWMTYPNAVGWGYTAPGRNT